MTVERWITFNNLIKFRKAVTTTEDTDAASWNIKMTDAGNESLDLEDILYGILRDTISEIQAGGRWRVTPEVREAELDINPTFAEAARGEKTVETFRAVCKRWMEAGTR